MPIIIESFHHIVYTSIEHNGHVAETLRRISFKLWFQYQSGVLKSLKTKPTVSLCQCGEAFNRQFELSLKSCACGAGRILKPQDYKGKNETYVF